MTLEYELHNTPPKDDDSHSLDSVMAEESREFGHLDRNVLGSYWRATGRSLGFWVIVSVLLMQVSRNLSDAWLAYWVGASNPGPVPSNNGTSNGTIVDFWSVGTLDSFFNMVKDFVSSWVRGVDHGSLFAEELQQEEALQMDNKTLTLYYLGIYSGLAVGNSFITLVRAFLFAYAGIKAAKCIHDKLLNSVVYVSMASIPDW